MKGFEVVIYLLWSPSDARGAGVLQRDALVRNA